MLVALSSRIAPSCYLLDVVSRVQDGKTAGDAEVGRAISAALASVPVIEQATFDKMFNTNVQDLIMLMYLSNLTRTQLALADRISGLL